MKKIIYSVLALCCALSFVACNDEGLGKDAEIVISFKVKGASGTIFNGVVEGNSVLIKVAPHLNAEVELVDAVPTFYLSRGATVTPNPATPQNFAQEGGVKYKVTSQDGKNSREYTVTWGDSDQLPSGSGFSYAEAVAGKLFTELGYPGIYGDTSLPSIEYGDLRVYHAYCGDNIVLLSRRYVVDVGATSEHCIKTVDKTTLAAGPAFNLGSISISDLQLITSDYHGNCVGAVVNAGATEFFYWKSATSTPVSVGSIGINVASTTDGSANFQVAGDITGDAWITAMAPRGSTGDHYRIKVTGAQLASTYSTFSTGHSSSDCSFFQMISPLDDSDQPSFIIGDTEGAAGQNNSIRGYVSTYSGLTSSTMPALWQNTLQTWWAGTGTSMSRGGGRSPVVSGMVINGKSYAAVTSGTGWWFAAAVLSSDMQKLAHENLNIAFDISASRYWSYGEWIDWCWNEDKKEGHLAVWFERRGLYTYKMTCYE